MRTHWSYHNISISISISLLITIMLDWSSIQHCARFSNSTDSTDSTDAQCQGQLPRVSGVNGAYAQLAAGVRCACAMCALCGFIDFSIFLIFSYLLVAGQKLPDGNGRWRADLHVEGAQQAAGQDHFRRTHFGCFSVAYSPLVLKKVQGIRDPCSVGQLHAWLGLCNLCAATFFFLGPNKNACWINTGFYWLSGLAKWLSSAVRRT